MEFHVAGEMQLKARRPKSVWHLEKLRVEERRTGDGRCT